MIQCLSFIGRPRSSIYLAAQLRGQPNRPRKPLTAIEQDCGRRTREMIAYAYRHVPYCRDTLDRLRLQPADFHTVHDLQRLRINEREQLQARRSEKFRSTFDADSHITISFVADLPRTLRGKVRPVLALKQQATQAEHHAA